jgi:Potassium-transporting ATPase A subunit
MWFLPIALIVFTLAATVPMEQLGTNGGGFSGMNSKLSSENPLCGALRLADTAPPFCPPEAGRFGRITGCTIGREQSVLDETLA